MAELVCIPRDWCDKRFPVGVTCRSDLDPIILDDAPRVFIERAEAEERDDLVQLAGYSVVRSDDRVLYYARGKGGGEGALYTRLSVGIGGHVERDDLNRTFSLKADLQGAAFRELHEELVIASAITSFRLRGFIRNTDDAVGRRHLGLLYEARLDGRQVRSREPDAIVFPTFATIPTLIKERYYDRMERWSQLVILYLSVHGHKEV